MPRARPQTIGGRGGDGHVREGGRARPEGGRRGGGSRPGEGVEGTAGEGRRARARAGRSKKMGGSQRPGRDGLLTLRSEMRQEGKVVSIAQLCRWFTVPRSSFYYTTRRRGPGVLDAALTMLVRGVMDAN